MATLVVGAALVGTGTALAVVGGSPDNGAHPYVVAVFQPHELCSGVLLSPTIVLTAAHCFDNGSTVQVTFGPVTHPADVFTTTGATYTGTVTNDPAFCFACGKGVPGGDTNDIAIVQLNQKVKVSRYAQLPPIGVADTLKNTQVDVVGYGISNTSQLAFGTAQIATTKVVSAGMLSSEFVKLLGDPGTCQGDSGGPNLLHGTDYVFAITAFSTGNPNCNGVTYSERIDTAAAQAFIAPFLR